MAHGTAEPLSRAVHRLYGDVSPHCQGCPNCERFASRRLTPYRMPVPLALCIHSSGWSNAPTSTSVECGPPPVELTPCAPARPAPFSRFSRKPHLTTPHASSAPSHPRTPLPSSAAFFSSSRSCPFSLPFSLRFPSARPRRPPSTSEACARLAPGRRERRARRSRNRRSPHRRRRTDPTSGVIRTRLGTRRP